jgi:hypothetical protein
MHEDRQSPDAGDSEEAGGEAPGSKVYEIPPEGSLGLLALGAVGIVEWRHARERARKEAEAENAAEAEDDDPEDDEAASEDE